MLVCSPLITIFPLRLALDGITPASNLGVSLAVVRIAFRFALFIVQRLCRRCKTPLHLRGMRLDLSGASFVALIDSSLQLFLHTYAQYHCGLTMQRPSGTLCIGVDTIVIQATSRFLEHFSIIYSPIVLCILDHRQTSILQLTVSS